MRREHPEKHAAAGPQDDSGIHATIQSTVFFGPYWRHAHIAGTDNLGRDIWVRTLHGARVSLMVGIVATAVALIIAFSMAQRRASSAGGSIRS